MRKALLVATVQSHIAQFHRPLIKLLQDNGYEIHIAARDNLGEKNGLKIENVQKKFNLNFERSPFKKENWKAYNELKKIIANEHYDIISCNTPVGGVLTRLAAKKARREGSKLYYTAHGFHFYQGAPLINWIVYYTIEKHLAKYTDKLIMISEEDYRMSIQKKFKTKCCRIHGVGVDTSRYYLIDEKTKQELREKLGYNEEDFIVICVGELNNNKNQKAIIKAVPQIKEKISNFRLLLAGNGPVKDELQALIVSLDVENSVHLLGYRTDLEKYIKMADIGISASRREGLGLNIIEEMLCGKPVIGSRNRGHNELIKENISGLLFDADNVEQIFECILHMYQDEQLRERMKNSALEIAKAYTDKNVIKELEKIYEL